MLLHYNIVPFERNKYYQIIHIMISQHGAPLAMILLIGIIKCQLNGMGHHVIVPTNNFMFSHRTICNNIHITAML